LLLPLLDTVSGSDWPTFRHDVRRSGISTDTLSYPLKLAWHRKEKLPPKPAFIDPLKHPTAIDFAYIRDHSEPIQLDFDHAFQPVAAKGNVFFGSSADDTVRCLSLATGKLKWTYVTGGPVRFAPQVVGDSLYVASDDGFVYCLMTGSGELSWKFRAASSARQLVGNGRMISRWPLRTGVLVLDDTVYVTAGMWPSEGVFVYALDAQSGKVKWVNDTSGTRNDPTASPGAYTISGVGPTGYLLAGNGALVVPTGRSFPASYALEDGKLLKSVAASYQNKRGGPITCIDRHGSILFGYPRERLTGRDYSLYYVYQLPALQQHGALRADRIIVDKEAYLTVNDRIRCATFRNSRYTSPKIVVHWDADCPGKSVHCMALAVKSLLMGVDNAVIVRDRKTGDILWQKEDLDGHVQSLAVVDGRILAATDAGSIYCFSSNPNASVVRELKSPRRVIKPISEELSQVLKEARISRGLALVVGEQDATLAMQLAAKTQLEVLLLLEEAGAVQSERQDLLEQTNPGQGKVSVQQHIRGSPLPYADYAFNIITTTGEIASERAAEMLRVLRPAGGVLYVDNPTTDVAKQIEADLLKAGATTSRLQRLGKDLIYRRGKLAGALDWDSKNKTDQRVKWPLELLWFGGPGSKRTGGGSRPPVAAGGRNFIIGKNHLIALDAYNGTELWSRTLPYLYRNIGRLRNAPGPINPWLTQSINADDENAYLNFGHVVYTLDAATGEQRAVNGELPSVKYFSLKAAPEFSLDHYQKPDIRGTSASTTKAPRSAGSIQLSESNDNLKVMLQLDSSVEITDKVYWELFLDVRPSSARMNLYEQGIFQFLINPALGSIEAGVGPAHPKALVAMAEKGRRMEVTIPFRELAKLGSEKLDHFSFAAALNHPAGLDQPIMAGKRGYLRWEVFSDTFAYAFNNGWACIVRNGELADKPTQQPEVSKLPEHALQSGRIGQIGKRAGYVVNVPKKRENPLSLEVSGFEFNRGKGCGRPVSSGSLQVLRAGTLAFYDINDDSGMRYFGGIRPSCTVSAVPAQGLVFAAEGSSGCNCNYNFKTTLALAPAKKRRQEDWAMFAAPLSPGALLRTGRFNLGAPGDRRDDGGLWLQYPRAPTRSDRTMPVPVKLHGKNLNAYRVNADRVPIANTTRPWLYTSGFEGIENIQLQLFMSDQEGVVVFPGDTPKLDALLEETAWERRYGVEAGKGGSLFLSHDKTALYVGYEIMPLIDRKGKREPWTTKGKLPYSARFAIDDKAGDESVWMEDSLEFLISDLSLKKILHFGIGVTGGRYDGLWSSARKKEEPSYAGRWASAVDVTADKAVAEIALPWKTLIEAGLDLDNLVIRPRTKQPLARQPHITHGFRPVLVQANQPKTKSYRVALHFAELNDVAAGERIFDIQLQGKTVLKGFDPVAAAGGVNRRVVRIFKGIRADRALDIRFITANHSGTILPPILSAVEVLLDK
ncbi:MAG: PQQ-binding-like beta-propeller repeat protein, partial [Verrucomicrobiota bacterium]|nr:PQQ-binding-like beta-propeller repeat protein [Verrucomicrobiota bacterium]